MINLVLGDRLLLSQKKWMLDGANEYKLIFHNPAKRPLSSRNPQIEKTLRNFVGWATNSITNPKSKSKVPFLKALPFTVNAIICAYHATQQDFPDVELAAGLCNQDSLEHMFSKLRQREGHVRNPTARMVRLSLRHILYSEKIEGGEGANVAINVVKHYK